MFGLVQFFSNALLSDYVENKWEQSPSIDVNRNDYIDSGESIVKLHLAKPYRRINKDQLQLQQQQQRVTISLSSATPKRNAFTARNVLNETSAASLRQETPSNVSSTVNATRKTPAAPALTVWTNSINNDKEIMNLVNQVTDPPSDRTIKDDYSDETIYIDNDDDVNGTEYVVESQLESSEEVVSESDESTKAHRSPIQRNKKSQKKQAKKRFNNYMDNVNNDQIDYGDDDADDGADGGDDDDEDSDSTGSGSGDYNSNTFMKRTYDETFTKKGAESKSSAFDTDSIPMPHRFNIIADNFSKNRLRTKQNKKSKSVERVSDDDDDIEALENLSSSTDENTVLSKADGLSFGTHVRRILGNIKKSEERSRQILLCKGDGDICNMLFKVPAKSNNNANI